MKKIVLVLFILTVVLYSPKVFSGSVSVDNAPTTPSTNTLYNDNMIKAWVKFDGTSCTGGAGSNECTINAQFNVDKVVRLSTGQYEVYWKNNFSSTNYVVNASAAAAYVEIVSNATSKTEIQTRYYSSHAAHNVTVHVMAIGVQ